MLETFLLQFSHIPALQNNIQSGSSSNNLF